MLRRLLEMLIIEAFVAHGMKDKIKGQNGRFLRLNGLIRRACSESSWALDDNGAVLRKLNAIGNWSAHKRRFVANREDIDSHETELRIVVSGVGVSGEAEVDKANLARRWRGLHPDNRNCIPRRVLAVAAGAEHSGPLHPSSRRQKLQRRQPRPRGADSELGKLPSYRAGKHGILVLLLELQVRRTKP